MSATADRGPAANGFLAPVLGSIGQQYRSVIVPRAGALEITVVGAVFLAIVYGLSVFLWTDIYRHSDTTSLISLTEATGRYGAAYNSLGGSVEQAANLWGEDAQTVCDAPLAPGPTVDGHAQFNHFEYHAYFFAYVLAPFTWLFPTSAVIAISQSIAMGLVLLLAYVVLRQEAVHPLGALLFVALVACYPVWNGALVQDLYMDRYFPPFALLYMLILYYAVVVPRGGWVKRWWWAIPVGVVAASTNDRSILYVIGLTLGMLGVMGPRALLRQRWRVGVLGAFVVALAAAFLVYQGAVHTSTQNTIPEFAGRWRGMLDAFLSPAIFRWDQTYAEVTIKFLVVNLVFFGIWGIFRWPLMLVGLGAMLPNVATTIAGAEKLAFGLEYHSQYMAPVLFAAAVGFAVVWRRLNAWTLRVVLSGAVALFAVGLLAFDPYQPGWVFNKSSVEHSGLYTTWLFFDQGQQSAAVTHRRFLDQVAAAVPRDAAVSVVDEYLPPFYASPSVYYYPIGIDTAQYTVVSVQKDAAGNAYFGGAVSYQGQGEALNKCLSARLQRDGYDVQNPRIIGNAAVLRRG